MRSGKENTVKVLSRPGRFQTVRYNLEGKEIVVGEGESRERYIWYVTPKKPN